MSVAKVKRYACTKCGTPFDIHPPDDLHTTASRHEKDCETRGHVKMEYVCKNCGEKNIIYWCRRRNSPGLYP